MKKKYILLSVGLILIGLGIFIYKFPLKIYVDWRLNEANYCEVKEDCINLGSKCPFGCYIYVNSEEEEKMNNLLNSFESKCIYGCEQCLDVECVSGECQPVCN